MISVVNGKKLKWGYTSGSCAQAGTKVALMALMEKSYPKLIEIELPNNEHLFIPIERIELGEDFARVTIVKDSGDDPDITNGMEVVVEVKKIDKNKNIIIGGIGVGTVTKKGLKVEVGRSAINPTPYKMIEAELNQYNDKFQCTISIPQGVELAKKTFNPKLGIVGGISILGTTGLVKPMSEEAFKDALVEELGIYKENISKEEVYFTFGNEGKEFAKNLGIDEDKIFITSNFIGHMIDSARLMGFKSITLIGNIGKAVKLAGGIFHTHSKIADCRMELLTLCAWEAGERNEQLLKIKEANTTEEAIEYIQSKKTYKVLLDRIVNRLEGRSYGEIAYNVYIFSSKKGLLIKSKSCH